MVDREIDADAGRWLKTASVPQKTTATTAKMKRDEIRALLEREPFRAFEIETTGGRRFDVTAADRLLMPVHKPELLIVFTNDGLMHFVEAGSVASVTSL